MHTAHCEVKPDNQNYLVCYFKMVAPRALVFRPLVKGNEALGSRLLRAQFPKLPSCACYEKKKIGVGEWVSGQSAPWTISPRQLAPYLKTTIEIRQHLCYVGRS